MAIQEMVGHDLQEAIPNGCHIAHPANFGNDIFLYHA